MATIAVMPGSIDGVALRTMANRLVVFGFLIVVASLACAQFKLTTGHHSTPTTQVSNAAQAEKQFAVPAAGGWVDTGIVLKPGDKVSVTSAGSLRFRQAEAAGPQGLPRSWRDVMQALPLNTAGRGALIGRIGGEPAVVPFLIGASKSFSATRPGHLFLRVNLAENESIDGKYTANIRVTPASSTSAAKAVVWNFDSSLLEQVPRRVTDEAGGAGDMVNFILIGSQEQMLKAFTSAGWVQVDRTKGEAVAHAILSTLTKQSYVEMPMSELYLYRRPQDYGMARAEPISVVQTRHHLRVWKAPFQIDGQDVWVGAATHDLGFEKDQRNGNLTHHIDPNVDDERSFVVSSLAGGGGVAANTMVTPSNPIKDAKTATGESFHSDGRVAVMQLETNSSGRPER